MSAKETTPLPSKSGVSKVTIIWAPQSGMSANRRVRLQAPQAKAVQGCQPPSNNGSLDPHKSAPQMAS